MLFSKKYFFFHTKSHKILMLKHFNMKIRSVVLTNPQSQKVHKITQNGTFCW